VQLPDEDLPDALYDYFAQELFEALDSDVQLRLSQLATVSSLSRDLAEKLLGTHATTVLNEGLRIGAIAKSGPELELHPLLREFLVSKLVDLGRNEVERSARRTLEILISEQLWDDAFHVIAQLSTAELLPTLVEAALDELLLDGRTQTISQWLDFAASSHLVSPLIDLAESEIAFRQGDYVRAEALALNASESLETSELKARGLIRAAQSALLDCRDEQALNSFRSARLAADDHRTILEALVGECFAILELGLADEHEEVFAQLASLAESGIEMRVRQAMVHVVRAARLGGIQPALQIAAEIRPLLSDVKDPLVVTSFLNAFAHLLVLGSRYEDALEISAIELDVAKRYRLQFVLPHALLVNATAHVGIRDFMKAMDQVEAAEALGRVADDVHIAMHSAALRARIAIARHDFEGALTLGAQRWKRPGSAPMRGELLAYRCLASACDGDTRRTRAIARQAREISGIGLEATLVIGCAEAVSHLREGASRAEDVARAMFALVQDTGGFDAFVTAIRGYPDLLRAVLRSRASREIVTWVLTNSNDFRLARLAGIELGARPVGPVGQLTARERQVAGLVAKGYTNQAIAEQLYISPSTAKVHVRHILEKLGARSRAELAARLATLE
jgi:ATP/maltotriose-dependent transcriptional regulator MalT